MSNLDNLTQKILEDAKAEVDLILKDAKVKSDGIVNSRVKEANDQKSRILERATNEAALMKERVISNAELRVRDEKLKAKQIIINKVFEEAKKKLLKIDDKTYIEFLQNNIKGLSLKGSEVLVVPEDMKERVKSLNLPIKVAEDETIDSGFIIKDKDTLLNFSFDSLVEFLRDELETEIAQNLFKG
ncbi:MAG TPA: V-type ATP synthase subunit E [Eubacteriaceae bacterium]|jgi:V/A-type H+-transporting ATPase subunit E|nr:V-type ATP synthase subunit E [Eubacteriaceae bacterium]